MLAGDTSLRLDGQVMLGYMGQDSWEREVNHAGAIARAAVEDFWIALEEPMPDGEVFRKNKRGTQAEDLDCEFDHSKVEEKEGEDCD